MMLGYSITYHRHVFFISFLVCCPSDNNNVPQQQLNVDVGLSRTSTLAKKEGKKKKTRRRNQGKPNNYYIVLFTCLDTLVVFVCVFKLNWCFHPSTSGAPGVRADASEKDEL